MDQVPEPGPSRRPLVLAALAGFVLGSGVLGLLWSLSGPSPGPAEDARAACGALTRAGGLPEPGEGRAALQPGALRQITAARELATAAAELNATYGALADHLDGVSRMVVSLNFADAGGRRHLAKAQELCSRL
ncbi:hypothetical protein [Amycolatopsis nigrescens]|uniref:hypothetical protein n=1 Tax=Amycolatopsis nigrescens TaxID=381445 RepID=UPI000375F7E6|nr:hypothetical protein [Amycolatopsis nigrescens]